MRSRLFIVLSVLAAALALGARPASADQVTLGDTCGGGPLTVSGTTVTGSAFNCSEDSTAELKGGSLIIPLLSYSLTPTGGGSTATLDIFCAVALCAGNSLTGTITWTSSTYNAITSTDTLTGQVAVSSVTGFNGEYSVGHSYNDFDLTLQDCTSVAGGVKCTDPSSGELPTPEPGTLTLLGMGLLGVGGLLRRKLA